jgi:hypothetical protein
MLNSRGLGTLHANLTGVRVLELPKTILRPTDAARELIDQIRWNAKRKGWKGALPNWLFSKSDTWEAGLLDLLFTNAAFGGVGDASGLQPSATAGSLYLSLHSADPGETGSQTTNESTYTNYARVGVSRASGAGGWTRSGTSPTQVANTSITQFPACGVTGQTVTHAGLGTLSTTAGKLLYSGPLTSSLAVSNGITPQYAANACVITED